jgi:DNA polymerase-4
VETIAQLAALDDGSLYRIFGRAGKTLRDLAHGRDERTVTPERETRSVSVEETFEYDLTREERMRAVLRAQAGEVAARLRDLGLRGTTVGVKIKRADFSIVARQTQLAEPTDEPALIYRAAAYCLRRAVLRGTAVRLLGTRVASLVERGASQTSLFERLSGS